MPNLRNGVKGGFEPGLTRLRVRHSTTELPRSINKIIIIIGKATIYFKNLHLVLTHPVIIPVLYPSLRVSPLLNRLDCRLSIIQEL